MDLSIVDWFKTAYPGLGVKTPKWASGRMVDEFQNLEIGSIVLFPADSYSYSSVRSCPSSALLSERLNEGKQWKTRIDHANKSVAVIRVS